MSPRRVTALVSLFSLSSIFVACSSDTGEKTDLTTEVCPAKLTIQTDWFPELEHGGTYQLIGPSGTADKNSVSYSGPMQQQYAVGGLQEVEILTKNFDKQNSSVLVDGQADMAYIGIADLIKDSAALPLIAIAKTLDQDPQMLMWDPTQFAIKTPTDIAASGASFVHFPGLSYIDFMIDKGYLMPEQSDPSYNGSDATWVSKGGAILQQGFATNEIYKYENDILWKDGGPADVSFFTVSELGFDNYPATITMLKSRATELDGCLKLLVPKMQQAWVDFYNNPTPITDRMIEINEEYDGFWSLSAELNSAGLQLLDEKNIGANSPDGTYCSFDETKVQNLYDILQPIYASQGVEIADDVSSVYTNKYCQGAPGR